MNRLTTILVAAILLTGCSRQQSSNIVEEAKESREAKAMLQGVWLD